MAREDGTGVETLANTWINEIRYGKKAMSGSYGNSRLFQLKRYENKRRSQQKNPLPEMPPGN